MRLLAALPFLPLISAAPWASKRSAPAPLLLAKDQKADNVGKYIVKFREALGSKDAVQHAMSIFPHDADHVLEHVFPGFAASLDEETLAALREHPDVSSRSDFFASFHPSRDYRYLLYFVSLISFFLILARWNMSSKRALCMPLAQR